MQVTEDDDAMSVYLSVLQLYLDKGFFQVPPRAPVLGFFKFTEVEGWFFGETADTFQENHAAIVDV